MQGNEIGKNGERRGEKSHHSAKSSFIDAVSINQNAYVQNTWE